MELVSDCNLDRRRVLYIVRLTNFLENNHPWKEGKRPENAMTP